MKVCKCHEPNDNVDFFCKIIESLNANLSDYKWVISDLDLVPLFCGDFSGIGGEESESVAYNFLKRAEQEKVVIINVDEMYIILEDTQVIRNGVFICLNKQDSIDIHTYRPKVESNSPEKMYDNRAKCEIRILDGELFFILEKDLE